MQKLFKDDAQHFLRVELFKAQNGLLGAQAPYEQNSAFHVYLDTFRAIEEFINLPLFGLNDRSLKRDLAALRLDPLDPVQLSKVSIRLLRCLDKGVVDRLVNLILQSSAMFIAFTIHGMQEAATGLQSVKHSIDYFQSRRRHLLAILYSLPSACKGSKQLTKFDALSVFLPQAEHAGISITTNYNRLILSQVYPDFHVKISGQGYSCSHFYEVLDPSFLEPERVSITEITKVIVNQDFRGRLEQKPKGKLFSAAELRNDMRVIAEAYAEFGLAENSSYATMVGFVTDCSQFCEDDYYIKLSADKFNALSITHALSSKMKNALIQQSADYIENLNSYSPFIAIGTGYVTTVSLLSRFMYHWKTLLLNPIRRFQIRSGFILEASVKDALVNQNYKITDIKRIDGSEFDVVATRGEVIYNIQCKNNFVDYSRIESNPKLFARYNRQLDRYYVKALIKEEAREDLLKERLQLTKVIHVIVSRFPIATANPRIIPFSQIRRFSTIADGLTKTSAQTYL